MRMSRSSYQSCFLNADGRFFHVFFAWYDDNKAGLPEKFYNPRYDFRKNLVIKYNLYDVKIDLSTRVVMNFVGETLQTPIDMDQANEQCLIWDTEWRGDHAEYLFPHLRPETRAMIFIDAKSGEHTDPAGLVQRRAGVWKRYNGWLAL